MFLRIKYEKYTIVFAEVLSFRISSHEMDEMKDGSKN